MKDALISTQPEEERLFLVGLQTRDIKREEAEVSLEELVRLAESTTGVIADSTLVNVRTPDAGTFLSKGLLEQLDGQIASADAGTVILDGDITPAQQHKLETRWSVKLLNRSELILDIFSRRAHTSDGKLQVELAQCRYRLPRLKGRGVELDRLGGGIGTRGPGEMKLETDRRVINKRIHALEERIARLKRQRGTQRARRQAIAIPTIALVGYTNAGKSTLMNALTGADTFVEDKLFATLDTTTRRSRLPSGMQVVFIDTVGFINRLPTQLFAAFRATLEEVLYADLLLHVVDATSSNYDREIDVTHKVLKELGAGDTPTLTVWNKIDALPEKTTPAFLERRISGSIAISALEEVGLDRLLAEIESVVNETRPRIWLRFEYKDYGNINTIETKATVHERLHLADGVYLLAQLSPELLERYEANRTTPPTQTEAEQSA